MENQTQHKKKKKTNIEEHSNIPKKLSKEEQKKQQEKKLERIRHNKSIKTINRQIYIMGAFFIIGFISMAFYVAFYIQTKSTTAINNSYNKRSNVLEKTIHRGDILSKDGDVLAKTIDNQDGTFRREYPYNELFCHVVGSYDHGKTGLELTENYTMLNYDESLVKAIKSDISGNKIKGNSIVTTLDLELTKICSEAMGNYKGAVIVSNPKTGEILAMVSKPDYNPNTIEQYWEAINASSDSILLNRATQGLYAPGSTFKIVTALSYLKQNGIDYSNYSYVCTGTDSFDSASIKCFRGEVHGQVDLFNSLTHSCNCSFANIGTQINESIFTNTTNKLLFNKKMTIKDFTINTSNFTLDSNSSADDKVQASIGQGTTVLTPLENLFIVSSIANDGKIMTPYIVDKVVTAEGKVVEQTQPSEMTQAMTSDEASAMKNLLKGVCKNGTAAELGSLSYECAGKTGSAEFSSSDESHAWFVGFAPVNDPQIAVSIIVEASGTGSRFAVPIAKKIFTACLGN